MSVRPACATRAPRSPEDFLSQDQVDLCLSRLREEDYAALKSATFEDAAKSVFPGDAVDVGTALIGALVASLESLQVLQRSAQVELDYDQEAIAHATHAFLSAKTACAGSGGKAVKQLSQTTVISKDDFPAFVRFFFAYRIHCYFETSCLRSLGATNTANPEVVFVLGRPGAGKKTQCSRIASTFGYCHISAGDLLRQECKRPGSQLAKTIEGHIQAGTLVPADVVVDLLRSAMEDSGWKGGKFLIDGFPRSEDSLEMWDRRIGNEVNLKFVLFFDCPEEAVVERLLDRGKKTGNADDTLEVIKKRFRTFEQDSTTVVEKFATNGLLRRVSSDTTVEEVWRSVRAIFGPTLIFVAGGIGSGKSGCCKRIEENFGYTHIKLGSLLMDERHSINPEKAAIIEDCFRHDHVVPSDIVVEILCRKLRDLGWAGGKYVIDGFPRSVQNLSAWEAAVGETALLRHCVYLECSEGAMEARALKQARYTVEVVRKKWFMFYHDLLPVTEILKERCLLRKVSAERTMDEAWGEVQRLFGPSVIFVLGGPGSGRTTHSKKISANFGYRHISAGDLLKEAGRKATKTGEMIDRCVKEGTMVPSDLTVQLIKEAMEQHGWEGGKYLIESFPRSPDNYACWKRILGKKAQVRFALCFDCSYATREKRIMSTGDVSAELFRNRWNAFKQYSTVVLEQFRADGIVRTVNTDQEVDSAWSEVLPSFGPSVIFVLGGPGAGKGTQCSRISERTGYQHISVGDLLREEHERPNSEVAQTIRKHMAEGTLVPGDISVQLVQQAMERKQWEGGKYLIDGFPRNLSNWESWTRIIGGKVAVHMALFFECSEEVMEARLLERGKTSGRIHDSSEVVKERIRTFKEDSMPIADMLEKNGVLRKVDSEQDVEDVWSCTQEVLQLELDPHPTDFALVLLKPNANTEQVVRFLKSQLAKHGIAIQASGVSDVDHDMFDQQYFTILDGATRKPGDIKIMADGEQRFLQSSGLSWADAVQDGKVMSARESLEVMGMSAAELAAAWRDSVEVQIAHNTWVASIPTAGSSEPKWVVNGFALHWRDEFFESGSELKWFAVEFSPNKLTWAQFREKVIGATDPAAASPETLRGQIYQHWEKLGLRAKPRISHNCIHASAGPLEGLREWLLWVGSSQLEQHPLARSLMAGGVPKASIEAWLRNAAVEDWSAGYGFELQSGPIFTLSENSDHADFRAAALRYTKRVHGSPHAWPVKACNPLQTRPRRISKLPTILRPTRNVSKKDGPRATVMTLLHFNDVYNVEPRRGKDGGFKEPAGGIARFVTRVKELKAEAVARGEPEAMCLFSGDAFNPSLTSTATRGRHMVPALNAIGIHTACYGNHDFDFGVDDLVEMASETNFPWLISNCSEKKTGKPLANGMRTRMVDWYGRKIGFLGLVEREWLVTLHSLEPDDVDYEDFCPCARRLGKQLREEGAELIIALTHMRVPNDELLANEVSEIDLILGGHDHHYDVKPVGPHGIYVLKSGTDFRDITKLTLRFTDGKGKKPFEVLDTEHVQIVSSIAEDPEMKALSDECIKTVGEAMDKILGETAVDLDCRFESIRTKETNIGNLVTDVMRSCLKTDVAVINSGTLRADAILEQGPFRMRDLCNLLPMLDELCILELSGEQLLQILQNAVSQYPRLEGRFLQVSGVTFTFDAAKLGGSRVVVDSVKVAGEPLDLSSNYRLTTLNYLRQGKDGFDALKQATCLADGEQTGILPTMVREHFMNISALNGDEDADTYRTKQAVKVSYDHQLARVGDGPEPMQRLAVAPRVEGRIICLNPVN